MNVHIGNTEFFEDKLGWTGLLIEGAPGNAAELMKPGNRPGATKYPMAVCRAGIPFIMMQGGGEVATDVDAASEAFIKRWHRGKRDHAVKVPCKPFGEMLRTAGLGKGVDVASIDVVPTGCAFESPLIMPLDRSPWCSVSLGCCPRTPA